MMTTRVERLQDCLAEMRDIMPGLDDEVAEMAVGTWSDLVGAQYRLQKATFHLRSAMLYLRKHDDNE